MDSQVNNDEQANATTENEETTDPRKAVIAAAVARAKAKKLATTSDQVNNDEQANVITENEETTDPRKALIAAAVARAKAKKLAAASEQEKYAKQMESMPTLTEPDNSEVIKQRAQRKEAARLHKQQCSVQQNEPSQIPTENDTTTEIKHTNNNDDDNKKAKIAAVIAKAKAQKLAEKDQ